MDRLAFDIVLFAAAFAGMEAFAWFTHKYVMHGFLWVWHESHHRPRTGMFELNDLFAVVFATPMPEKDWKYSVGWDGVALVDGWRRADFEAAGADDEGGRCGFGKG